MSNPTSNFNWQMPTSSDLVTDLPADFEVFGQAVDTSLADLKGGTTGQVLKKNTDADMDFVWSADAAGMTNPMTTTGDTIYSSSGSTPARLGIGTTGQVLTVAGGVPTWATASSGGMTLLASGSLTGSSVSITSISQDYNELRIHLNNWKMSSVANLNIRINNVASSYSKVYNLFTVSTYTGAGAGGISEAPISNYGQGTSWPAYSVVTMPAYSDGVSGYKNCIYSTTGLSSGGNLSVENGNCGLTDSSNITRIDFLASAGTFATGTYKIYGVK